MALGEILSINESQYGYVKSKSGSTIEMHIISKCLRSTTKQMSSKIVGLKGSGRVLIKLVKN